MMDPRIIEVMKYARVPLVLNGKEGQNAVIVTDTSTDPLVWQSVAAAANELGIEATVTIMTTRSAHGYNPTSAIMSALRDPNTDLCIYLTTMALAHAKITDELAAMGKAILLMDGNTVETLSGGPAAADYAAMNVLGEKVARVLTEGSRIRVQSDSGTDLTANIEGRAGIWIAGILRHNPATGGRACGFPDGESNVCPVEGTGDGMLVFDTTAHSVGLLREPMKLTVEKGWVTKIEGGVEAETWRRILEDYGDKNSYNCPAEIAVGLNPNVIVNGIMRNDKKMYGASHIGVGDTIALGGTCNAKLRLEGVIRSPVITVDDQVLVENNKIFVD